MKQRTLLVVMQGMMKENLVPLVMAELKKQPFVKELGGELSADELAAFKKAMSRPIKDGVVIEQTDIAYKHLVNACRSEQATLLVTDITSPVLKAVAEGNHFCNKVIMLTVNEPDAQVYEKSLRALIETAIKGEHILTFGEDVTNIAQTVLSQI